MDPRVVAPAFLAWTHQPPLVGVRVGKLVAGLRVPGSLLEGNGTSTRAPLRDHQCNLVTPFRICPLLAPVEVEEGVVGLRLKVALVVARSAQVALEQAPAPLEIGWLGRPGWELRPLEVQVLVLSTRHRPLRLRAVCLREARSLH